MSDDTQGDPTMKNQRTLFIAVWNDMQELARRTNSVITRANQSGESVASIQYQTSPSPHGGIEYSVVILFECAT